MRPLTASYTAQTIEAKWQQRWEEEKTYAWDASAPRELTFVIDTPPPTVSGLLHMGHVYSFTQTDFIARYQRMQGKTIFYPMGFDDNGLPTERLVEKTKNIRANRMDRQEFIGICRDVVAYYEDEFRALFRSIALSVDWSLEYQTISADSRKISQMSFLDLYRKNNVYRAMQPTLWDPTDQTALAQADVEDKELPGTLYHISFRDRAGTPHTIATTRPEMLPACVAVVCHPDDARYQALVGSTLITPLFDLEVPVIADTKVDPEKGSGLVMCCTFGDLTDVEWWRTHRLPTRIIFDQAGRIVPLDIPGEYAAGLVGLKISEARAKCAEWLQEANLVTESEDLVRPVKCAERSGTPLEILTTTQWFVTLLDHRQALLERAAECKWHPAFMKNRIDQWILGLHSDWCISRQRFFGVPFPVWYSKRAGEEGKILVAALEDLPVDPFVDLPRGYSRDEVEPDRDVMDTWATSSVSPQLNSRGIAEGLVLDADRHRHLFPADLRPQAHEIIRTWAFYTIVKAYLHQQTIPWQHVMVSGWCLAEDRSKMSKSKGNVVTPVGLIADKGADVVRYWASTSRLGADSAYSENTLQIGRKLVTKLWNAAKFASMQLEHYTPRFASAKEACTAGEITEAFDLWALTHLERTITLATEQLEQFEYCSARMAIEEFFWKIWCDNYLECTKTRVYNPEHTNPRGQLSGQHTIYFVMQTLLRLFAPFLPHIAEELWQQMYTVPHTEFTSIHARGTWPQNTHFPSDANALQIGQDGIEILDAIRKVKADHQLSLKAPLARVWIAGADTAPTALAPLLEDLRNVTSAVTMTFTDNLSQADAGATHLDTAQFSLAITLAPTE
jgi:valyl-tRNA synthetase